MNPLSIEIPLALAELCGETTIWPVWITTPAHRGYTYYGGAFPDGTDRFLATSQGIWLVSEVADLWSFRGLPRRHSLSDVEGFSRLAREVSQTLRANDGQTEVMAGFDFSAVLSAFEQGLAHQPANSGMVLDCLNAIRDIAIQFGEQSGLPIHDAALDQLYRVLWGVAEPDSIDYPACNLGYERAVAAIERLLMTET